MVNQASVHSQLESIVGAEGVMPREELSTFAVDGLVPQAAVAPSTYEQVAAVMRYAHAEGLAVIAWGGGAHMHIGNVPRCYDIALSLSRLDRVVEHEPADLTITCQAGISLAALQRHLAGHGQLLPLDPRGGERATIGGILAANASGPWRHAFGSARDMTIGLRVVTAEGRITRAGGRVVKNVAGYDLCKLYIGSLGTLGVIVEATFKLAPLPKAWTTVVVGFDAAGDACAFAADIRRRGLALRAVQLLNAAALSTARLPLQGRCALILDLAGTPQAVERSRRETVELAAGTAAYLTEEDDATEVLQRISPLDSPDTTLLCKATALPTRLPHLIEAVEAMGPPPRILALPAIGVLYASWPHLDGPEEAIARLRAAASAAGGSLVVERCPPDAKGRIDVFGEPPPSFELMRRIKQQFDPLGVFSPGRFVGRL